ncbi:ABC transporter permease [Arachnia propionica]|uniref:ABC transporter permease n=1 Tax=Arachnia propionica TaxID=1750 RepID=A0A3P1T845_9ACTN|nr:FtsX-like permease family protein [Arachnia propionica]RRD05428.1 ABC transporter permease [Arachnia propionica]
MRQLSWHSFPERLGRAALLATVVAVMTTLIGLSLSLSRTVSVTAEALAEQGKADLMVQPTTWLKVEDESALPNVLLSQEMIQEISQLDGVASVTPRILGRGVQVMSDDGTVISSAIAPTVSGLHDDSEHSTVELTAGRTPAAPGEVVLDERTLRDSGHSLDEEVQLVHDSASTILTAKVVGVIKVKGHDSGSASFVLFGLEQARQLFVSGKQEWNAVALHLAEDANRADIASQVQKIVPFGYSAESPSAIDRATRFWLHPALTTAQATFTGAGIFLAAVAIILTSTTFGRLARQQRQALAQVRVLGANRRQTWASVMTEAAAVSAVGAFVGAVAALLLQGWIHGSALATGLDIGPLVGLDLVGFLLTILIAVACTLVGAHPHAMAASRAYPVTARISGQPPRWLGDEAWTGLGLMAVGFLLLLMLRLDPALPMPLAWALFGAIALTGGAVIGSALICQPVMHWLGDLLTGPFGGLAKVATSQATGHPRRLSLGVSAMLVGTVLLTAPTVVASSGERTASERVPQSFAATTLIRNERGHHFTPAIAAEVAKVDGVSDVTAVGIYDVETNHGPVQVAAAEPGHFQAIFTTTLLSGRLPERPNEVMVSATYAQATGLKLSDLFNYKVNWKPAALRVVGIFDVAGDVQPAQAVTTREAIAERGLDPWDTWVGFTAQGSPEELSRQLEPVFGSNPLLEVVTPAQLGAERAEKIKNGVNAFQEVGRFAFLGGLLAIALLLTLSVMDREREYGSLRVIGADGRQIGIMLLAEGAVLSVLGVGLGTVLGVLSGWGVRHVLLHRGYSILSIPWGGFLLFLLLALPLGALAAAPAAHLASRTEVTDSTPVNS